jgi:hypothetical protein
VGRELALVNMLEAPGADIATITKCELPDTTAEVSVSGFTTFTPLNPATGKTRVVIIVENSLAVKANVKLSLDLMDPLIQLVWLHFDAHVIRSGCRGPPSAL